MGHFFRVFATYSVESCTADVSKGMNSKGDKAGRSIDKSYMEKQKQPDWPVERGGGAVGPILCSLKYISWACISFGRRRKLEPVSKAHRLLVLLSLKGMQR